MNPFQTGLGGEGEVGSEDKVLAQNLKYLAFSIW